MDMHKNARRNWVLAIWILHPFLLALISHLMR